MVTDLRAWVLPLRGRPEGCAGKPARDGLARRCAPGGWLEELVPAPCPAGSGAPPHRPGDSVRVQAPTGSIAEGRVTREHVRDRVSGLSGLDFEVQDAEQVCGRLDSERRAVQVWKGQLSEAACDRADDQSWCSDFDEFMADWGLAGRARDFDVEVVVSGRAEPDVAEAAQALGLRRAHAHCPRHVLDDLPAAHHPRRGWPRAAHTLRPNQRRTALDRALCGLRKFMVGGPADMTSYCAGAWEVSDTPDEVPNSGSLI